MQPSGSGGGRGRGQAGRSGSHDRDQAGSSRPDGAGARQPRPEPCQESEGASASRLRIVRPHVVTGERPQACQGSQDYHIPSFTGLGARMPPFFPPPRLEPPPPGTEDPVWRGPPLMLGDAQLMPHGDEQAGETPRTAMWYDFVGRPQPPFG